MFDPRCKQGKSPLRRHPWQIPQLSRGAIFSTVSNTTRDKMTHYFKQQYPTEMRASRVCGPLLTIHKCHILNEHSFKAICQRSLLFALSPLFQEIPVKTFHSALIYSRRKWRHKSALIVPIHGPGDTKMQNELGDLILRALSIIFLSLMQGVLGSHPPQNQHTSNNLLPFETESWCPSRTGWDDAAEWNLQADLLLTPTATISRLIQALVSLMNKPTISSPRIFLCCWLH